MADWPDSWSVTTLGEAAEWWSGGTPRTTRAEFWGGGIPWITSGSLTEFKLKRSDRTLTEEGVAHGSRLVPPGTTLFVVRGMSLKTEFRIGIATRPMAFGQDCKALRPRRADLDELFLAYAIRAQSPHILKLVDEAGHGTGRLNTDQMKGLVFGVPPLPEQLAITDVLGALDDKVEANERTASVAKAWVGIAYSGGCDDLVPLSAIADVERSSVDPAELGETIVDHFSLPAFDAGQGAERISAALIGSQKLLVPSGSVLVSRLNPRIPRVWRAEVDPRVPALCSTEFLVLRPTAGLTAADVWATCSLPAVGAEFAARVTGTSGSHQRVRPHDAMSVGVPDPRRLPADLRSSADAVLTLTSSLDAESALLAQIRDGLLPKLLSGELRVHDANMAVEVPV